MKHIPLFMLLLLMASCGYQKPEEDKYPDLPLFPEHTNNKILITEFPHQTDEIYYNSDYFFVKNYNSPFLIFDRQFKKVKQINDNSISLEDISLDGDIYTIENMENDGRLPIKNISKYPPKSNFRKESIENLKILPREFYEIRDSIKKANPSYDNGSRYIDSLYDIAIDLESKKIEKKLNEITKGDMVSYFPLDSWVTILKYPNKEIALYTSYDHLEAFKDIEERKLKSLKPIWDLEQAPKSFGSVVLENSWSGNHFVGGYRSYGLNYVELSIDDEVTTFKVPNGSGSSGVTIIHERKDTLILKKDSDNKLFYVTKK